jgi:hypothetical protein
VELTTTNPELPTIIVFVIVLTALVTSLILYSIFYEELEQEYKRTHIRAKAGHKSAFTKLKKNYKMLKKIAWRGRK